MSRGAPDYGQLQTETVVLELGNLNQPAFDYGFARMDGGGRVVFFEDFRAGLYRWTQSVGGTGALPVQSLTEGTMFGFYPSVLLNPIAIGQSSRISTYLSTPLSGKIGIEIGLYLLSTSGQFTVNVIPASLSTKYGYYAWRILASNRSFQVANGGAFVDIYTPSASSKLEARRISTKVVIDPNDGIIETVFFNGLRYSGSWAKTGAGSFTGSDLTYIYIAGEGAVGFIGGIYIGYVVVTCDEP